MGTHETISLQVLRYCSVIGRFAHLAMPERAAARAADEVRLKEDFAAKAFVVSLFYKEENDEARLREGLLNAGLPLD
jgi:hypothetical protein